MGAYPLSYQEQAQKINTMLKEAGLGKGGIDGTGRIDHEKVINAFIWAGQVAKFRCRNNSAYESFMRLVLKDIADVKYVPFNEEFDVLRVVQMK